MIPIVRSKEPGGLAAVRTAEIARVQAALGAGAPLTAELVGKAYRIVATELRSMQWRKCCYCEYIEQEAFNDVEHFRPKAQAKRGASFDERGYWWLAWSWDNLLFACANCNRSAKNSDFPLDPSSKQLRESHLDQPPGDEQPLIIDPAGDVNPFARIEFRPFVDAGRERWKPFPRHGDPIAVNTIECLGLDRSALVDDYSDFVVTEVRPRVEDLREAVAVSSEPRVRDEWRRLGRDLLGPGCRFVALAMDAINHLVPQADRDNYKLDPEADLRGRLGKAVTLRP